MSMSGDSFEKVLRSLVSDKQWRDYRDLRQFDVTTTRGNRYRINGIQVRWLAKDGSTRGRYCIHSNTGDYTSARGFVVQFLGLVADEVKFIERGLVLAGERPDFKTAKAETAKAGTSWVDTVKWLLWKRG